MHNCLEISIVEQFAIQLDFFEQDSPSSRVSARIDCLATTLDSVRKRIFAENNNLGKKYISLTMRCDTAECEITELREKIKKLEERLNEI